MQPIVSARRRALAGRARSYTLALAVANTVVAFTSGAQSVSREAYLNQILPTERGIVNQATASKRFNLYGDTAVSGYIDRLPVDGIDDTRAARLHAISERFSPILKRNTFVVPRPVWWAFKGPPMLRVDTWLDGVRQRHLADSMIIHPQLTRVASTLPGIGVGPADLDDDARLKRLIEKVDPERSRPSSHEPMEREATILFFDLPGYDDKSWRREHEMRGHRGSRIYAHFFIHEERTTQAAARFLPVIQFWFFYPFNDGPNDHEGDWEHINVQITTREAARDTTDSLAFLSAEQIVAVLDGRMPLDRMVIRAVDYYFHHLVHTVDYLPAHRGQEIHGLPGDLASHAWEDHDFSGRIVRDRLAAYPAHEDSVYGRIATHPVGYIAGNNRGMDEFAQVVPRFSRAYNRNSGATYPFALTWLLIGPVGATEAVHGAEVPPANREAVKNPTASLTDLITDDDYLVYAKNDIDLLPDWERVIDLVRRDRDARQEWAWMLLPIRWGYPATGTILAVAPLRDLGNRAPFGPAFTTSWNRAGPNSEHERYDLHVLRTPMAPTVPWSVSFNGLGFLNYPTVIAQMYPFYNVMGGHLGWFGIPILETVGPKWPRTAVPYTPRRMATMGVGVVTQFGGGRFARAMLPAVADDSPVSEIRPSPDEHVSRSSSLAPRFWLDLHVGKSYYVENSYSFSESVVRYSVSNPALGQSATVIGALTTRQFTGGIRVRLPWTGTDSTPAPGSAEQLFSGRLGYGWTRYSLGNITVDGVRGAGPRWGGYNPTFLPSRRSWPNLAYTGLTYEWFSARKNWLVRESIGYGVRVDVGGILQRLNSREVDSPRDIWVPRGEASIGLMFGW